MGNLQMELSWGAGSFMEIICIAYTYGISDVELNEQFAWN